MHRTEQKHVPLGLDAGTSRIVLATGSGAEIQFHSELNAFTTVPYSKLTASVLEKENIPHTIEGRDILVHGNEAARFADLAHAETRRPMVNGVLNPDEPTGVATIRSLIQHLTKGETGEGRPLCVSIPAPGRGNETSVTYHEAAVRDLLTGLGYEVRSIAEGLAVVYSELEDTNYTGIGVSLGGGMCNITLAYLSVPITSFSVARAGDFIDANAAAATGESTTRIRMLKEQAFRFNGSFPDRIHQALGVYYDEMIRGLAAEMAEAFATARGLPKLHRPIPLVISGGSSLPHGFRARFEQVIQKADLPIAISEVRSAADPMNTTAKGALVAAMAEQ